MRALLRMFFADGDLTDHGIFLIGMLIVAGVLIQLAGAP